MSYLNVVGVGDSIEYLRQVPDESVDACICDPPYGLGKPPNPYQVMRAWCAGEEFVCEGEGFMAKKWDAFVPGPAIWKEVFRILKPGGWLLAFFGTRTYDWGTMAIRFAGFVVCDQLDWVYGCLSEDTEVLIDGRWEPYSSAIEGRLALCYDKDQDIYRWAPIEEVVVYDYAETAFSIKGKHTDQIVSRNHRVLTDEGFILAEALPPETRVPVVQDVRSLLRALPVPQRDSVQSQQDMRQGVQERANRSQSEGASSHYESRSAHLRVLRHEFSTAGSVGETREGALLLSQVQRSKEESGLEEARAQGASSLDRRFTTLVSREDEWSQQPGLERRRDLFLQEGQLREREVRSLSAQVRRDGAERRLRDGAQVDCRSISRSATDKSGGCSPRGPRSDQQRVVEPDAVRIESGPQTVRGARFTSTDLVRVTPVYYEGKVWCLRVPTGAFVCRRNGQVFVTGNSGFPKSHDISKAIDALVSVGRSDSHALKHTNDEVRTGEGRERSSTNNKGIMGENRGGRTIRDKPATPEGAAWEGWGTALKPAHEPIAMCRKPFEGTFAEHVLEHGTGVLNIEVSRIGGPAYTQEEWNRMGASGTPSAHAGQISAGQKQAYAEGKIPVPSGRWPTNVILSHRPECQLIGTRRMRTGTAVKRNLPPEGASRRIGNKARTQRGSDETYASDDGKEEVEDWQCVAGCPVQAIDQQSGSSPPSRGRVGVKGGSPIHGGGMDCSAVGRWPADQGGGASRFFYTPKAKTTERRSYCRRCKIVFQHSPDAFAEHDAHKDDVVSHPTQKPLALMEYLVKLVTQPGGVVVDPFCGTGTTAVTCKENGFGFVTCDLDADYARIADARLAEVGGAPRSALTTGAYFCPGCRAKGEIKLIARDAVNRMRESGRKTTCMQCMERYSFAELTRD